MSNTGLIACRIAAVATLGMAAVGHAQAPDGQRAQRDLLRQFAGNWELAGEVIAPRDRQTFPVTGTESVRMLGEHWLVSDVKFSMAGMNVTGVTMIGYDPAAAAFVGSYVSSLDSVLWKYAGEMDGTGSRLTLETEGPSPLRLGETARFRETLELRDSDHKLFTSSLQLDDGTWMKVVNWEYRRTR